MDFPGPVCSLFFDRYVFYQAGWRKRNSKQEKILAVAYERYD